MTKFNRKKKLKAAAILTADWHIRSDTPICRTDNFFAAMEKKIDFIFALSKEHACPILVTGDIGHKPQWPNWLLEWFISKTNDCKIICIPGQHDLPNHKISLFEESGMGVLEAAEIIETIGILHTEDKTISCHFSSKSIIKKYGFHITPFPYGSEIKSLGWGKEYGIVDMPMIAMTHQMIIENKILWPDQTAPKGHQILKKFSEYQLILSGDNHNAFTIEYEGRLLVNPGSIMRAFADQENHRPRVYLWYAETNEVEPIYLPIKKNVISRTHIDIAKERKNRNQAFIERVNNDVEIELSYEVNLENYFNKYRTEKLIKEKIWDSVE